MATPYVIGLIIQYPAGTRLANVNVTVRNEATNQSNTKTTNSVGEVVFNLGSEISFPSGWTLGDKFSWVVIYQGFEAYGSHTTASGEGGFSTTVVLTAVATAPTLKLFTPQEFLDYFNLKIYEDDAENGIKIQQLVKIGRGVEQQIENETNNRFDSNNGDYYEQTEYIDTNKNIQIYHTQKIPINSVTNLYTTGNDEETTPDYTNNASEWNSLTRNTDYVVDNDSGRIQIVNSSYYPITRRWGLYVVYRYGRATVPSDIKILAILETGLRMSGSTFVRDKIRQISTAIIGDLNSFEMYRKRVMGHYFYSGLNTLNT